MRVDQFVFAVRTKVVPLLVCLRSSCCHVTGVGGPLRFVRIALKNGMQNDGDFVDVIPLYTEIFYVFQVTKSVGTPWADVWHRSG